MNGQKSVLVVGAGSIGERHLRCFAATGLADISFCEPNDSQRNKIAERYQIKNAFSSLEQALAEPLDIAVICTPAHLHIPIATDAARAGMHLLIEKPLAVNPEGIAALEREIADRGLIAAVAYVYRGHPALAAMREAILGGRFGAPLELIAVGGQHFPQYRPAYRQTYYNRRATGGGAVQDALTHIINAGEWLVGPIDRLVADMDHQALEGVEVEDSVHVITRHGNVMGCFSHNQHQFPNENTITVICQRGTLRFEYHNCRWRWTEEPGANWHDETCGPLERDTLFIQQAEAFLRAVEGEAQPLCPIEEAIQTLRANLAILASAESHTWQTVTANTVSHA